VGTWLLACDGGDEGWRALGDSLGSLGDFLGLRGQKHPSLGQWQVAPGPAVTRITVIRLELGMQPPELHVGFDFTGRRIFADPRKAPVDAAEKTEFSGYLTFTPAAEGRRPWVLTRGHVDSYDHAHGYVFTRYRETPGEFARRTGSSAAPVVAAGPVRAYRLVSGFAEHDERLGASAEVEVSLTAPPAIAQAKRLIEPAIWAVTVSALGEGDWRPSMNWLDVIELLEEPPVSPKPGPC
jgi:hypothetical protein